MKKILSLIFVITLNSGLLIYGQTSLNDTSISIYNDIPQEKIFVHHNASFFLVGENLYYKVYTLNSKTDNLSKISKIAYVELINNSKKLIFKHKVKLESGLGQGDFFIPKSIPSGNYKLIAYTQWMRNGEENHFFHSDISIINPYLKNQKEILKVNELLEDSLVTIKAKQPIYIKNSNTVNRYLEIKTNAVIFRNREKVSLNINALKNNVSFGNYSISVRKTDTIEIPIKLTANSYNSLYHNSVKLKPFKNNVIYLPELRGELLSGKVLSKGTGIPTSNVKVALSISGKEYLFKISNTNASGIFYFNLGKEYEGTNVAIQVISNNRDNFSILLKEQMPLNYNNLVFNNFKVTSNARDLIVERSIYNQIENAYATIKPDSIMGIKSITPFFNAKIDTEYTLDDFTRFPTVKETIVEVINFVSIRKKKGVNVFHVKLHDIDDESGLLPLLIVDGLLVQNHEEMVDFNAKKVKKISVVRDKYIYGSQIFDGIISIETIDGDYKSTATGDYIQNIVLFKPQIAKVYFNQTYDDSEKFNRIPDYRNQLLWKPNLNLNTEGTNITFFTSDNRGDYEICLEGFTKDGEPVSLRKIISVK